MSLIRQDTVKKKHIFNLISHNHSERIFTVFLNYHNYLSHCILGLAGPVQWFLYITSRYPRKSVLFLTFLTGPLQL